MGKIPLEAAYYYSPAPGEKEAALRAVCAKQGVRFRALAPQDAQQTVGFLVGLPGYARAGAEDAASLPQEMLLLHHFRGQKIDRLLAALRQAAVPRIELKAVVTEHNAAWTLRELFAELRREHDEFARRKAETAEP